MGGFGRLGEILSCTQTQQEGIQKNGDMDSRGARNGAHSQHGVRDEGGYGRSRAASESSVRDLCGDCAASQCGRENNGAQRSCSARRAGARNSVMAGSSWRGAPASLTAGKGRDASTASKEALIRECMKTLSIVQLRNFCCKHSLDPSGDKSQLMERVLAHCRFLFGTK